MTSLIDPIRCNLKFGLPKDKALTWNPSGLHVVQFYNTLSIFSRRGSASLSRACATTVKKLPMKS